MEGDVSFFKRLALFILILTAMILFFGLFPVVAQSAPFQERQLSKQGFKLIQPLITQGNDSFAGSLP
jgi:hypothetical protein